MASWSDLERELDGWTDASLTATLWWRDDDAAALNPDIERLVALANAHRVPLHLAAIPLDLSDDLVAALQGSAVVRVLQHGYAHVDHAPKGAGSWELGDHRPRDAVLEDLALGVDRLGTAFGERFLPVLVPPWTRIDPALVAHLPDVGLAALSMEGTRTPPGTLSRSTPIAIRSSGRAGRASPAPNGRSTRSSAIWRHAGRAAPMWPSPPDCAPIISPMTAKPGTSSRR
jgi:hypothetical protein